MVEVAGWGGGNDHRRVVKFTSSCFRAYTHQSRQIYFMLFQNPPEAQLIEEAGRIRTLHTDAELAAGHPPLYCSMQTSHALPLLLCLLLVAIPTVAEAKKCRKRKGGKRCERRDALKLGESTFMTLGDRPDDSKRSQARSQGKVGRTVF